MPRCAVCHRRLASEAICPGDGVQARVQRIDGYVGAPPARYPGAYVLGVGGFATTWCTTSAEGVAQAFKWARRSSQAASERFAREAQVLNELGSLAAPALIESGVLDSRPYLLMELVEGPTLGLLLEGLAGPLPEDSLRPLARELVRALDLLHGNGFVHRDLKPDNVFVKRTGATLIDFGLARSLRASEQTVLAAGTPEYAAPEQLRASALATSSDVYSLGVMLYELATLRLPFLGQSMPVAYEHANLRPTRPSRFARISTELEDLLLACLEKDPAKRPTTSELATRLGDGPLTKVSQSFGLRVPAESQRAVAFLLGADDLLVPVPILERVAVEFGAQIVSYRGSQALLAWLGDSESSPIEVAELCAARLALLGATRLCLHLDQVRVLARKSGPSMLFAACVEETASWWPGGSWAGVRYSDALAHLQVDLAPKAQFIGREAELDAIVAIASECFEQGRPGIVTLVGPPGCGKTRLLKQARDRLAARYQEMRSVDLSLETALQIDSGESLLDQASRWPLCVVADDLMSLPSEVLDALEYASAEIQRLPLLLLCSLKAIDQPQRPTWGLRAGQHCVLPLDALGANESKALLSDLLQPASYVPNDALEQLAAACSGNPGTCYELARALHRDGYIVESGTGRFVLDTTRLHTLPSLSALDWSAAAQLARQPPTMARLLCLCALLNDDFSCELVVNLVEKIADRDAGEIGWPDGQLALIQWRHAGILTEGSTGYSFASSGLREALARRSNSEEACLWHELALAYYQGATGPGVLAHCAYHAMACKQYALASRAWIEVGQEALRGHRPVEADRAFGTAMRVSAADPIIELQALCGSGAARYRIGRASEAVEALRRAATLAHKCGDVETQMWSLLEGATALDWAQRFEESAKQVDVAWALAQEHGACGMGHRLDLGRGRSAWRRGELSEAITLLCNSAEASAALGDIDCRIVALLLLAPALVLRDDLVQAEARFDELIALCESVNDRLHLCAAYGNRMFLWSASKNAEAARDDLREAMRLARQVGHPGPERVATYNLAEDLYWSGENDDEAHQLALRSWELAKRYIDVAVVEDALLVGRTALACEDSAVAQAALLWCKDSLPSSEWSQASTLFAEMIDCASGDFAVERWKALLLRSEDVMGEDDHLELCYWYARCALRVERRDIVGSVLKRVQPLLCENPIWTFRFAQMHAGDPT